MMHKVFINDETVPVEEYEAISHRLTEQQIEFVERKRLVPSLYQFGSTGAGCDVMVKTEQDAIRAREIIEAYQAEIVSTSRAQYIANQPKNRRREMLGWALALIIIGLVLALSLGIGFW